MINNLQGELELKGHIWYAASGMSRWQASLRLIGVGWYIGSSIVLGVVGGLWLDNKFNTKPLFVVLGLILGVVVAAYGVYQMLLPLMRNKQDKEDG